MATRIDLGSVVGPQGPPGSFTRTRKILDAVSVPSGTATVLGSVTLSPGTYLIIFFASFPANATGARYIVFGANADRTRDGTVSGPGLSGQPTILNGVMSVAPTSSTVYNLYAYQNTGNAMNVSGGYTIFKLS